MGHSERCKDLQTHWDEHIQQCVVCDFKPGQEVTPNCGFDDNGGRHEGPTTPCRAGTFNDGSRAHCRPCSPCPPGQSIGRPCTATNDGVCSDLRSRTTEVPVTEISTPQHVSTFFSSASKTQTEPGSTLTTKAIGTLNMHSSAVIWAVPLAIVVSIMLAALSAYINMKRKRGQPQVINYNRRSSYINQGFSPLTTSASINDLGDIVSPNILSAPLQTVLDNLDVLEEMVILLDPESQGIKNTKHLASLCAFPSTWITYTYCMKDNKSPLKAVLEGVTSRNPDWTVGHLAKLLRHMERNDAIAVLAKLRLSEMEV